MTKIKSGLFHLQIIPHHGGKPSQKYQQKPGGRNSNRGHEGTLVLDCSRHTFKCFSKVMQAAPLPRKGCSLQEAGPLNINYQ